jgi:stage V sporulation protein B
VARDPLTDVGQEPSALASEPAVTNPTGDELGDPGVVHNVLLQIIGQVATAVCTAGLTLYLVRALGASHYGVYVLAASIGGLLIYPAGVGLPTAVGRFLADHRRNLDQLRAIVVLGLKVQVPVALVVSVGLFALSGPIAEAYGHRALGWPLRWMAIALFGQTMYTFFVSICMSLRRLSVGMRMSVLESVVETSTAIVFVIGGAGAAGAMLGKAIGYLAAAAAGLYLMLRLLRGLHRRDPQPSVLSLRRLGSYAGVMLLVDITWSAITSVDVLLIAAILSSTAVGQFGAVLRLLGVLGYIGIAVSDAVAPRLSLGEGTPDTSAFNQAFRFLIIVQGLVIAPLVVWAGPIVHLTLGPGYGGAANVMRWLALYWFISAPGSLISISVTYLGEGRRRVVIVLGSLVFGLVITYVLLKAVGLVGAAIGDDLVEIVYISAHLWICSRLIALDLRRLAWSLLRTLLGAASMAVPMLVIGTSHLSAVQAIAGGVLGAAAYVGALLLTRELAPAELRLMGSRLRGGLRPASR